MKSAQLLAIKCILYLLYIPTAWATSITLGDTLTAVPALAWLMVLVLSTLSGLAALLNRLKEEIPARFPLFVIAHMAGSLLAGLLTFFVGEAADMGDMAEAVSIALAAWAGAAFMDRWAVAFSQKVAPP